MRMSSHGMRRQFTCSLWEGRLSMLIIYKNRHIVLSVLSRLSTLSMLTVLSSLIELRRLSMLIVLSSLIVLRPQCARQVPWDSYSNCLYASSLRAWRSSLRRPEAEVV